MKKNLLYVTPTFIFHKNFTSRNNTQIYNFSHRTMSCMHGYVIVYDKASWSWIRLT